MTKKSDKSPTQNEKGHESCVWSWKNIFGFRSSQTTRKRSSDKRHVSNHIGIGYRRNETKSINKPSGSQQWTIDGEETTMPSGDSKPVENILAKEETTGMLDNEKQNAEIRIEEDMTSGQDKEEPTNVLVKEEMSDGLSKEGYVEVFREELTGGRYKENELSDYVLEEKMTGSLGKEKDSSVQVLSEEGTNGGHDKEEPSVLMLRDEEVTGQKDEEKVTNHIQSQIEEPRSIHGGRKKKTTGNRKKSRRKTASIEVHDVSAYEDLSSQFTYTQNSDKQSLKDHKIDNIMEEFCRKIHQRSIRFKKHDQNDGIRLSETIKEFIHQKLKDIDQCFEEKLMDAFEVLSLEEELFLKLIQDPDSPLKKSLRYWKGTLADKNRNFDFFAGSNLSEHKSNYSRKPEGIANHKQNSFFKRMVKSEDRSVVKEGKDIHASNKMVTIKSRSTSSPRSDTESHLASSLKPHCEVRKKVINEGVSSYFFFTKLGGIIRSAIRRERPERTSGTIRKSSPGDGGKTNPADNARKSSPGKDGFFSGKFSKASTQLKRGENCSKEKDCDSIKEQESARNASKKDSEFNFKAKRHLSRKISRVLRDPSTQHVSATLGRILSLSETNRRDLEYSLDIPLKSSDHDKFQTMSENTQLFNEEKVSHPENSDPLKVEEYPDYKRQSIETTPNVAEELTCDDMVKTRCPMKKESKIDVKAKKHLSWRLKKRRGHEDSKIQSAPDILGRILSLSEYNSSPVNVLQRDSNDSSDMPLKIFEHDKVQMTQWLEEEKDSHTGQCSNLKPDSCLAVEYPDRSIYLSTTTIENACPKTKKESKINIRAKKYLSKRLSKKIGHEDTSGQSVPETLGRILSLSEYNLSSINSHELTRDNIVETPFPITGDADISNAKKDVCQEDSCQLDASSKPVSCSSEGHYRSSDLSEVWDSCNSSEVQSLQSPSPSSPSYNNKDGEVEVSSTQESPRPSAFIENSFPENNAGHARTIFQPDMSNHSNISMEDKKSIFECVNALLQASNLNLDELYMISHSPDHLLEPSLLDEVEFCEQLHHDKKLLFDITNDILVEVHSCYFRTSPWVSFAKPGFKPIFNKENTFAEVWKGVCWYLFELQLPCTPDMIIKEDMERSRSWLDLRYDAENIGFRMGDAILDELVEDTIRSCLRECQV